MAYMWTNVIRGKDRPSTAWGAVRKHEGGRVDK